MPRGSRSRLTLPCLRFGSTGNESGDIYLAFFVDHSSVEDGVNKYANTCSPQTMIIIYASLMHYVFLFTCHMQF